MSLFQPEAFNFITLKQKSHTILITGGSSGIGLATATLLSSLNPTHNLILLDLRPPPSTFPHSPSYTLFLKTDVASWTSQRAAFEAAYAKFGCIDAVFVNAGIISEYEDQFFTDSFDSEGKLAEPDRRTLTVDLNAASDTTKLAIHYLRKNSEGGSIVLTASVAGYLGVTSLPLYSAAKHGIIGLLRALKAETAKLSISISAVAPGITVTPLLNAGNTDTGPSSRTPEEYAKQMAAAGVPVNRVESVALAVCYLLNEGIKANGAGIFIQNDKFWDMERGLAKSRAMWMSQEMLDDFRGGRGAHVLGVPSKAKM